MRWADRVFTALEVGVDVLMIVLMVAMVGGFIWLGVLVWIATGPLLGVVALAMPVLFAWLCLVHGWSALRDRHELSGHAAAPPPPLEPGLSRFRFVGKPSSLTAPPKAAEFFEYEDVPLTRTPDGAILAWRPEPGPFPAASFGMASSVDRKTWDGLRADWAASWASRASS